MCYWLRARYDRVRRGQCGQATKSVAVNYIERLCGSIAKTCQGQVLLNELDIEQRYRTDRHDLLTDFYLPCLGECSEYSRAVGYFTSNSLSMAARGVNRLIKRRGKMRIVASPVLSNQDAEAIREGYKRREEVLSESLLEALDTENLGHVTKRRLEFLAWLVAHNLLDIKLALVRNLDEYGIYHEKVGIFRDNEDNRVVFIGSANESRGGLVSNFESIQVYRSWVDGDAARLAPLIDDFERLWQNRTRRLEIHPFPEAVRRELIKRAPGRTPERDPEQPESPELASQKASIQSSDYRDVLNVTLYDYQEQAVEKWLGAGSCGILAMATGAGKTITAFGCAAAARPLNVLVVGVPTTELIQQWCEELAKHTEFSKPIRIQGSANSWNDRLFRKLRLSNNGELRDNRRPFLVIGTYSELSKSRFLELVDDAGGFPVNSMLICDEVHRAGAPTYQQILRDDFQHRLGLSATPIREYDEEGTDAIINYFQGIVSEFSIDEGIERGILCEYEYHVELVGMTDDEFDAYRQLTSKMSQLASAVDEGDPEFEETLKRLAIQRANILKNSERKRERVSELANAVNMERSLIYCADIKQATTISRDLSRDGISCARYSSADKERNKILGQFANGEIDTLVAIKCLDEGVDVPAAKTALMVASDASERQFIQRRGRVLRASSDKDLAHVYDFLVVPPEDIQDDKVVMKELRRVRKFAESAINRMTLIRDLVSRLSHFGISHSDFLEDRHDEI